MLKVDDTGFRMKLNRLRNSFNSYFNPLFLTIARRAEQYVIDKSPKFKYEDYGEKSMYKYVGMYRKAGQPLHPGTNLQTGLQFIDNEDFIKTPTSANIGIGNIKRLDKHTPTGSKIVVGTKSGPRTMISPPGGHGYWYFQLVGGGGKKKNNYFGQAQVYIKGEYANMRNYSKMWVNMIWPL